MTVTIAPDGGRGIGPDPDGSEYPLVAPSGDVRGLLASASLVYRAPPSVTYGGRSDYVRPLRITWLAGFDAPFGYDPDQAVPAGTPPDGLEFTASHAADLVIQDSAGLGISAAIVFDSRGGTYSGRRLNDRLYCHEWVTAAAVCRVVQHTAFPTADAVSVFPPALWPASAVLDPRTYQRAPDAVRSLQVGAAQPFIPVPATPPGVLAPLHRYPVQGLLAPLSGAVQLVAGYNIALAVGPTTVRGLRRVTTVTVSAVPGAGAGVAPAPAAPPVVRRVNGQAGDARGNLQLVGLDCYAVRQPSLLTAAGQPTAGGARLAARVPHTLAWSSDCPSCWQCADFVAVARAIQAAWDRFAALGARTGAVRADYQGVRARWQAAKTCRESQWLALRLVPHELQYLEVTAEFVNHQDVCLHRLTLTLALATAPATDLAVAEESTFQTDGLGGLAPAALTAVPGGFKAYWATVPPRSRLAVRFRLIAGTLPVTVEATLTGEAGGLVVPGGVARILTLNSG